MTYTMYLVIEDEDGTHVREWGLNNYDNVVEAEVDARDLIGDWYNKMGLEAWSVEPTVSDTDRVADLLHEAGVAEWDCDAIAARLIANGVTLAATPPDALDVEDFTIQTVTTPDGNVYHAATPASMFALCGATLTCALPILHGWVHERADGIRWTWPTPSDELEST